MTEFESRAWPAPAKINLFLHVLGRRSDGFHEIQTLFQLLDWGDEVLIRATANPCISRLEVSYDVPESQDLAIRAAKRLQAETGCRRGAEIGIRKHIPPGSGMGGGSSDAATVLLVLNRLWGCELGLGELARLGASLGADVPVFVLGRTAMARGKGERLEPVDLGPRHYVLVFPGFAISTAEVFSDTGLARNSAAVGLPDVLEGRARNDCEAVVRKRFPAFAEMMNKLREWGQPRMTGTGSGIFIQVPDEKTAKRTAEAMKSLYNVRAVRGVDRSPAHDALDGK